MQITEALRLQLDVQRRLHVQLEVEHSQRSPIWRSIHSSLYFVISYLRIDVTASLISLYAPFFFFKKKNCDQIQRNMQLRIEAQGRKLQEMFEQQMKANRDLLLENESLDADDCSDEHQAILDDLPLFTWMDTEINWTIQFLISPDWVLQNDAIYPVPKSWILTSWDRATGLIPGTRLWP